MASSRIPLGDDRSVHRRFRAGERPGQRQSPRFRGAIRSGTCPVSVLALSSDNCRVDLFCLNTIGNGSFDGTTGNGSSAQPWATIQHAVNQISGFQSSNQITVNVAAGTYAGFQLGASQIASWKFVGSGVSTCTIDSSSSLTNTGRGIIIFGEQATISGFTIKSLVDGVASRTGATVSVTNTNFIGTSSTFSSAVTSIGGTTVNLFATINGTAQSAAYTISGPFSSVFFSSQSGSIDMGYNDAATSTTCHSTFTFGTTSASAAVAASSAGGSMNITAGGFVTFAGATPTGVKFNASTAGGIFNASLLPGSSAGVTVSPGWTT